MNLITQARRRPRRFPQPSAPNAASTAAAPSRPGVKPVGGGASGASGAAPARENVVQFVSETALPSQSAPSTVESVTKTVHEPAGRSRGTARLALKVEPPVPTSVTRGASPSSRDSIDAPPLSGEEVAEDRRILRGHAARIARRDRQVLPRPRCERRTLGCGLLSGTSRSNEKSRQSDSPLIGFTTSTSRTSSSLSQVGEVG